MIDRSQGTRSAAVMLATMFLAGGAPDLAPAAQPAVAVPDKPYIVEWVYKVKWGHSDEFFDIFRAHSIDERNTI